MPLARYFLFVGGVLLALLFVADAYLPKLPDTVRADTDLPAIRIHSDRKWPERVVFDTSQPTIVPAQTAALVTAPPAVADAPAKARVREAFAQLQPSNVQPQPLGQKQAQSSLPKKPEPKLPQRKIAKKRAPPMVLVAQQPQFGFFANSTW
jgi:hypothetical protein